MGYKPTSTTSSCYGSLNNPQGCPQPAPPPQSVTIRPLQSVFSTILIFRLAKLGFSSLLDTSSSAPGGCACPAATPYSSPSHLMLSWISGSTGIFLHPTGQRTLLMRESSLNRNELGRNWAILFMVKPVVPLEGPSVQAGACLCYLHPYPKTLAYFLVHSRTPMNTFFD